MMALVTSALFVVLLGLVLADRSGGAGREV